uniref:Uncharacterized protein n=1 Tax=Heterorhabditis bacteriophora TaxID=37862 RepID=A0A1I7WRW3_HETBA
MSKRASQRQVPPLAPRNTGGQCLVWPVRLQFGYFPIVQGKCHFRLLIKWFYTIVVSL